MAPRLSPFARTSAVTNPRQLAPTVGLSHDGLTILEGKLKGLEGYAVGQMTKSRRGKIYIDDTGWGPEAVSIEYGYRVPILRRRCRSCPDDSWSSGPQRSLRVP